MKGVKDPFSDFEKCLVCFDKNFLSTVCVLRAGESNECGVGRVSESLGVTERKFLLRGWWG